MSTNQLKKLLIGKIEDTNDEELLQAVYKLLDFNSSAGQVYQLSDEQKNAIETGKAQIANGESVSNEDLEREIDKWLKE